MKNTSLYIFVIVSIAKNVIRRLLCEVLQIRFEWIEKFRQILFYANLNSTLLDAEYLLVQAYGGLSAQCPLIISNRREDDEFRYTYS